MVKLKDIVNRLTSSSTPSLSFNNENKSNSSVLASSIGNSLTIAGSSSTGLENSKIDRFAEEVATLISKDSFIDELDNRIGKPQPNESEDIFVNRAKNRMRELLREKLK